MNAIDPLFWSYRAPWAKAKGIPVAVNATIEKSRSLYWKSLWKTGRVIIPADGWYEWQGEKGNKEPWHIKLRSAKPFFMAALTSYHPNQKQQPEGTGFVILTSEAAGGLIDVHDRRPVVLGAEDAKVWLDIDFNAEQAEELARQAAVAPEEFEWFRVTREVNKAGNESPEFVVPIRAP